MTALRLEQCFIRLVGLVGRVRKYAKVNVLLGLKLEFSNKKQLVCRKVATMMIKRLR